MADRSQRLTKRQQRLSERGNQPKTVSHDVNFELSHVHPKTENQVKTFRLYESGRNLFLHGSPGTGKSFLSLYLSLREVLDKRSKVNKVVIVRSAQPSKNIGFLPGSEEQKMAVYEAPYVNICNELFGRGDAYEILKKKSIIEFHPTSFLRGTTFEDSVIILDEAQNSSYMELKTVLTRTGNNSKVIVCGDMYQDDLTSVRFNETSGISTLKLVLDKIPSVATVEFDMEDIVRSGFTKEFIIAESQISSNLR